MIVNGPSHYGRRGSALVRHDRRKTLSRGLVGHWGLSPGGPGLVADMSGMGNHADLPAGNGWVVDGEDGYMPRFTTSGGYASIRRPVVIGAAGTLVIRMKPETWNGVWSMILGEVGTTDDFFGYYAPGPYFRMRANGTDHSWFTSATGHLNAWQTYIITIDGNSRNMYVNDVFISTSLVASSNFTMDSIGYAFLTASAYYSNKNISYVKVYDRPLSRAEVTMESQLPHQNLEFYENSLYPLPSAGGAFPLVNGGLVNNGLVNAGLVR